MNLNYAYDKQSLVALAQTANRKLETHNLVIDFDGEVIIDPELYFPNVPVSSYKFFTRIEDVALRYETSVAALYDALETLFWDMNNKTHLIGRSKGQIKLAA